MRQVPFNPSLNALPSNIAETDLIAAIKSSGYPLRGIVTEVLKPHFAVTEEWGYTDRDSGEHRSLDLRAVKDMRRHQESLVRPAIVLLVECTKSPDPFVFFANVASRRPANFPALVGLREHAIDLNDRRDRHTEVPNALALGLHEHPYIASGPAMCAAFSRATLPGAKPELPETDLFGSMVLPHICAFDYIESIYSKSIDARYLSPRLLLCISVIDAPMIVVERPGECADPVLTPWVRIIRREAARPKNPPRTPSSGYVIDVVHSAFLADFLSNHLLLFCQDFAARAEEKAQVFLKGGEVDDLDNWSWDAIRPRA